MKRFRLSASTAALAACLALAVPACTGARAPVVTETPAATPELGSFGVDLTALKPAIRPGDNFFEYVNGTWLDSFEIPADFTNYGSFTRLFERSEDQTRAIIEDFAASPQAAGTDARKIGDFYTAFLDTDAINAAGLSAAEADLANIDAAATHRDILALMAEPDLQLASPISTYIYVDAKQTDRYLVHITQSGLGMPDRD
ncbi:MAG: M13 family peptidase, partial [Hyphomonas sp.]|nr:M13 family peptidase [Hyphomonas sp.]